MKDLTTAAIALLLVLLAPPYGYPAAAQALWSAGLLSVWARLLQVAADRLRLPAVSAWLAAGLLLGGSGLRLVQPAALPPLLVVAGGAALWVGFRAGLNVSLPAAALRRIAVTVYPATAVAAAGLALALLLVTPLPWWAAVTAGGLASLWGPFSLDPRPGNRFAVCVAAVGATASLLFVGTAVCLFGASGLLAGSGPAWAGRVAISLLAGMAGGAVLRAAAADGRRYGALSLAAAALLVAGAVLVFRAGLFALPCGFGAGLVAARRRLVARRLLVRLRSGSLAASMLFFATVGAGLDLHGIWPLDPVVWRAVVALVLVLAAVRAIGIWLAPPLPALVPGRRRELAGLLVPRGALLAELCLHPRHSVLSLLGAGAAPLLRAVFLVDILVHLLLLASLAHLLRRRAPEP